MDPRFTTQYAADYSGTWMYEREKRGDLKFILPASVTEKWCEPGYQPKRPNKGIALTMNDYPFHYVQHTTARGLWGNYVYPPTTDLNLKTL